MTNKSTTGIDPVLDRLATAVTECKDTESLVRPLLSLIEHLTGLDSVYLTHIDWQKQVQIVLWSKNAHELVIPENLEVPLHDTLCQRAINESHFYEPDVPAHWADAHSAVDLGVRTYLSAPVKLADQEIFGTLCALGQHSVDVDESTLRIIQLFSELIARQIDRERLIAQLRRDNQEISAMALTDTLTGVANRLALRRELSRQLANAKRQGQIIHLAFIDLNNFKHINDHYGHEAGDQFLQAIATSLTRGLREGDFVARYGGDEFVVFGTSTNQTIEQDRAVFAERLMQLTSGRFELETVVIDYAGPSIGVVSSLPDEQSEDDLIERADKAMYVVKKNRRAT